MSKIYFIMSIILVACLTIGGVSAAWIYSSGTPDDAGSLLDLLITKPKYTYTVTYINNSEVLDSVEVEFGTPYSTENETAAQAAVAQMGSGYEFSHWINAGSTRIDSISADNKENITLYPSFVGIYTAIFVDQDGNILDWCTYTSNNYGDVNTKSSSAQAELQKNLDADLAFDHWEVHVTKNGTTTKTSLADYKFKDNVDITIYPVCTYNGAASLIPVDEDGDGDTDFYQVGGYNGGKGSDLVAIPGEVNGITVTAINANAFSSYADLHAVVIPDSITSIGSQSFAEYEGWQRKRQTITIYFDGTKEQWADYMARQYDSDTTNNPFASDWDDAMGEKSAVFFLDENGKVDLSQGYWELAETGNIFNRKYVWQYHSHPYGGSTSGCGNEHNNTTNYSGTCDCDSCGGAIRPDAEYWN